MTITNTHTLIPITQTKFNTRSIKWGTLVAPPPKKKYLFLGRNFGWALDRSCTLQVTRVGIFLGVEVKE
jgi:hypothetical protein